MVFLCPSPCLKVCFWREWLPSVRNVTIKRVFYPPSLAISQKGFRVGRLNYPMSIDPTSKNVLITGANRGIGKAILESFLAHGAAKVYAAVRNPATVAALTTQYGNRVIPVQADLSQPATIYAAAELAKDVDIVVNNAGVLKAASPFDDAVFESLDYEIEVNVKGLLHVARAFAPVLKARGGGVLVQLNSVASMLSFADFSSYCASKAAAYSFTVPIRNKLKEQGTHVLSVHPGPIATDMANDAGLGDIAEPVSLVSEGIIEALKAGKMHLFPDTFAKQVEAGFMPFATSFIEAEQTGG